MKAARCFLPGRIAVELGIVCVCALPIVKDSLGVSLNVKGYLGK